MAAPRRDENDLHPTTDSNFRNDQYDQKNIFANTNATPRDFGVQNAEKVVSMSEYRGRQQRTAKPQIKPYAGDNNAPAKSARTHNPSSKVINLPKKKTDSTNTALKGFYAVRGIASGITAFSWTTWLWLFVQVPFAIVNLVMLGLWSWKESEKATFLEKLASKALDLAIWTADKIASFIGGTDSQIFELSSLFFISWVITITVGLITIMGVLLQNLFFLLHPLSGKAAGAKMALICAAAIGYMIPGLNLFPWIWLYILVMMRYPK